MGDESALGHPSSTDYKDMTKETQRCNLFDWRELMVSALKKDAGGEGIIRTIGPSEGANRRQISDGLTIANALRSFGSTRSFRCWSFRNSRRYDRGLGAVRG